MGTRAGDDGAKRSSAKGRGIKDGDATRVGVGDP